MNGHAGRGPPPYDGGKEANHQVQPDTGNRGSNACPFAAHHPDLGGITEKGRSKIKQAEPHFLNGRAEVLSHQAVSGLVDGGHRAKQKPELHQVRA